MFVLHWICALTLTLVCSFTCQPLRENTDVFELESLIKDFNDAIEESQCLMDGTYYSPTKVKMEECVISALNCTLQELRVIGSECDMTDNQEFKTLVATINNAVNDYKNIASNWAQCKSCDLYPKVDIRKFEWNLIKIFVRMTRMK